MAAKKATLDSLAKLIIKNAASADKKFAALAEDISGMKDGIADLKTEMMEQFEHVNAQFRATDGRLRDTSAELAAIRRSVEKLEEQGASSAGFAKEIDHPLERITAIEKHLGLDKKIAA